MYNTIMSDLTQSARKVDDVPAIPDSPRASGFDLPRVHVVATGGTIAMQLDPDKGGAIPAVSGAATARPAHPRLPAAAHAPRTRPANAGSTSGVTAA